jgi:rhamnulokinase
VTGGLPELRELLRRTQDVVRYEPRGDPTAWDAAEERSGRG